MTSEDLSRRIADFLADAPNSIAVEDGQVLFDLGASRYSITSERNKCVLQMWSVERNAVRRVWEAENKNGVLRLTVSRFGQSKPHKLEICSERDRRTPAAKKAARSNYERLLGRVLQREFADYALDKRRLSSAVDLVHSFGPAYARGLLRKGRGAFAVLGVNAAETSTTIDSALGIGLLWLARCREQNDTRCAVEGLKLFLPPASSETVRARAAHLNTAGAKVQLYELRERDESLVTFEVADGGNIATRLIHCPDQQAAMERFAKAITRVREIVPAADAVVLSSTEIAFRLHGLEFARARTGAAVSFAQEQQIVFGAGRFETALTEDTRPQFAELMRRVVATRRPSGDRKDALWRMQPERWLEAAVIADVSALDSELDPAQVYSQVPAFAASDRAMIDVLACTKKGRLAVIELKADEDLQLPMQGLDYWSRVNFHHQRGEFQKFGYFPGRQLSTEPPLLYLVAPALHVHPTTDTLLKCLSPKIEWKLLGVDENWRQGVRVIFRKSRKH